MGAFRNKLREEQGVIFILFIVVLLVLLAFAALALDVGNVMVVRNELQNIADGAALAGARTLGRLYECDGDIVTCPQPMPYPDQLTYVADDAVIKQACIDTALQNKAGGKTGITINDTEIVIGTWDATNKRIDPVTLTSPDAVQVTARRDATANGPISTFFARIFGMNTVDVSATATAALTGQSTVPKGGLPFPAGIPRYRFENKEFCQQDIKFYPTGDLEGCAGWHVYDENIFNKPTLQNILQGLAQDPPLYTSPETTAFESTFTFGGGVVANLFDEADALFEFMKDRDEDGNPNTWTTTVVVYDWDSCDNPNKKILIVGFATVTIREVTGPTVPPPNTSPVKTIIATVECDKVESGRGSAGNYGTKGSIPGLVQ
jgi:hypothetical protein